MATSRIAELASLISRNTAEVENHLLADGLPCPTFDADQPPTLVHNPKIAAARQAILEATDELHALMLGPISIVTLPQAHNTPVSLQGIYRFKLATSFPTDKDEASFEEISQASGLNVQAVRRLLRHAIAHHIFREPRKGFVAHTAASKLLATDSLLNDSIGFISEEMWPSATKIIDALEKWPGSEEPTECGFNLAHSTGKNVFEMLAENPERSRRYENSMKGLMSGAGREAFHTVDNYAWDAISNGTVIDVGGNDGGIAIALLQRFPSLKCIVQDQAHVVAKYQDKTPPELAGRLSYMEHDFFTPQPVSADIYYFRWIMHDWSDKYAIRILRALIPALKKGARIVINDHIIPDPGTVSSYEYKHHRSMDFAMLEFHNAKERDADDWATLFHDADPRFKFLGVKQPPAASMGIIEAEWDGGDAASADETKTLSELVEGVVDWL